MPTPNGPQFKFARGVAADEDEGPYCSNCSDDIEEVMDWNSDDRQRIHPAYRAPCKGCGAV
jgi:hypothetical protein